MGIATSPQQPILSNSKFQYSINLTNLDKYYSNNNNNSGINSMSQDYHHQAASGIFNYSNGFERSTVSHQDHVAQQIRRDKLRLQGFEGPPTPLVGLDEESGGLNTVYETAGMLSEMFNFPQGGGPTTASELLEQQTLAAHQSYRNSTAQHPRVQQQQQPPPPSVTEWLYGSSRQFVGGVGSNLNDSKSQNSRDHDQSAISHHHHHHHHQQQQQQQTHHHHHQISSINADTATAMPFFLMNPQPRSPSPPSSHHHHQISNTNNSSTLHMLLPNPSVSIEGFTTPTANTGESNFGQFTWVPDHNSQSHHQGVTTTTGTQLNNPIHEIGGVVEGQGLSLSLSSSLQHLEAAKAEELRNMGDGGLLYYNPYKNNLGSTSSNSSHSQALHNLQAGVLAQNHQVHIGFGSSLGAVNVLRNSKYVKAAQELLEEFCSVGRGQFKKNKFGRQNTNPNNSNVVVCGSSSSSKESPPLTASDRIEHQRRKVKLLSMLDEVDRRYNHYCEQMQMVVNSFDLVMGFGAAIPYTALAQKAMSRHFRCLKDAISAQLKHSCDLLGEKDGAGSSGITKGETPRLKMLEQSLRQQRAFHQMGMMEQEAWRPQRGLPERSVNILRAWLFEHFLHPYPSDADKHLLARQTGLSRNQVSNWFINARVRLWKPMVEEMYQQEAKESDQEGERSSNQQQSSSTGGGGGGGGFAQTPTPTSTKTTITTPTASEAPPQPPNTTTKTTMPASKRSDFNAPENDPSLVTINKHHHSFSENQAALIDSSSAPNFISNKHSLGIISSTINPTSDVASDDTCRRISMVMPDYGTISGNVTAADHHHHHHHKSPSGYGSTLISFGTTSGDVSLTLGLHHAGNIPDNSSSFSVRDFGG